MVEKIINNVSNLDSRTIKNTLNLKLVKPL